MPEPSLKLVVQKQAAAIEKKVETPENNLPSEINLVPS